MFLNNTLTRVIPKEIDIGMGYTKLEMTPTYDIYDTDRQPYSPQLARKQYGLSDDGVRYRCFTTKKGLKAGDYVACEGLFYLVLLANDWENHTEIILGVFKNG